MTNVEDTGRRDSGAARPRDGLVLLAAFVLLLCMLAINRAPLFYFDTGGYLAQGHTILKRIGLVHSDDLPMPSATLPGEAQDDGTVVGSRSALYSVFLTGLSLIAGPASVVAVQSAAFLLTLWLSARAILREAGGGTLGGGGTAARLAGIAGLAALLGGAPFYTASLMPDIFAAILILAGSTLVFLSGVMRHGEILALFLLAGFAAMSHLSHLAIATLMVPAGLLAALVFRPPGRWRGLLLLALVVLSGAAERLAFSFTVQTVARAEVTYVPLLTARLIVDGPGLAYLADTCPDPGLATCVLYEQLRDHPERVTPTNIIYERDPALGSFALLPAATQNRIAAEQRDFALAVFADHPIAMMRVMLLNTLSQLGRVSVHQTLPLDGMLDNLRALSPYVPEAIAAARLTAIPAWLGPLDAAHATVYLVCTFVILAILLRRRFRPDDGLAGLATLVLLGILANAAVCGAISQPADRYGARVALLLPPLLALLLPFVRHSRERYAP